MNQLSPVFSLLLLVAIIQDRTGVTEFGVRRQSEAATALWMVIDRITA